VQVDGGFTGTATLTNGDSEGEGEGFIVTAPSAKCTEINETTATVISSCWIVTSLDNAEDGDVDDLDDVEDVVCIIFLTNYLFDIYIKILTLSNHSLSLLTNFTCSFNAFLSLHHLLEQNGIGFGC